MNEELKQECITRMQILKLDKGCIEAFKNNNIWLSENIGALYELDEEEKAIVDKFEQAHTKCKVYHIIHNLFEFGNCYTLLYVDLEEKEYWEEERKELADGYAFTYVENTTDEWCSEFGSVYVKPSFGGVMRLS